MLEQWRKERELILWFESSSRKPIDPARRLSDFDAARIFSLRGPVFELW